MTTWSIAEFLVRAEQSPRLRQIQELDSDESEELMKSLECFKETLDRTTFRVLARNYQTFADVENHLRAQSMGARPRTTINPEHYSILLVTAIVNYLTGMRMFLDHAEGDLKRRDEKDGGRRYSNWRKVCSDEYDDYFAYRFLYRFRNYVLHVGLPLAKLEFSTQLVGGRTAGRVFLSESPSQLVANYSGWSTVAEELNGLSSDIDLAEQIHVSMECLQRVFEALVREDKPELEKSVLAFRRIVGDLASFEGQPLLAEFAGTIQKPRITTIQLDVDRFRFAERITGV